MGKGREWDYAFRIKGVTPRSIPLARMAEYMKEFAGLLGDEGRPVFAGMVDGSVVLRARDTKTIPAKIVTGRLRTARVDRAAPGGSSYAKLNDMLANDGAEGIVIDRDLTEIIELPGRGAEPLLAESPPQIVSDVGTLDGIVVSIGGRDDTMHLQLQDFNGKVRLITVRSVELARRLAPHFRGDSIRVHVHGTWRRSTTGWEPESLYADRFEELDQRPAREVFAELALIPGNGWAEVGDPGQEWRSLRGDD